MAQFGYTTVGANENTAQGYYIQGCLFDGAAGVAESISIYLKQSGAYTPYIKCAIYDASLNKIAESEEWQLTASWDGWKTFNLTTNPTISDQQYYLCVWGYEPYIFMYDTGVTNQRGKVQYTYGAWPDPISGWSGLYSYKMSMYCTYTESTSTPDYTQDADCDAAFIFAEGSGTSVADVSDNGNEGTFASSGHPAWSADVPSFAGQGEAVGSVEFDGSDVVDMIDLGTQEIATESEPLTFVCWAKLDTLLGTAQSRDRRLFSRSVDGEGICLYFSGDDGVTPANNRVYFEVPGDTYLLANIAPGSDLAINTWTHFAVTWDGTTSSSGIKIYINSVLYPKNHGEEGSGLWDNAGLHTFIGNLDDGSATLDGKITQVAFFDRVLSAGEIGDIFNYGLQGLEPSYSSSSSCCSSSSSSCRSSSSSSISSSSSSWSFTSSSSSCSSSSCRSSSSSSSCRSSSSSCRSSSSSSCRSSSSSSAYPESATGTAYYVDAARPNDSGDGLSWATAKKYIQSGVSAMGGGDRLYIKNGTYTNAQDFIDGGLYSSQYGNLKNGTASQYTRIYAETDFGVTINIPADNARHPCAIWNRSYVEIRGIRFMGGSSPKVYLAGTTNHCKIIRCCNNGAGGNTSHFLSTGTYNLFEECYAWGYGRYPFGTFGAAQYNVFRRCLVRWDGSNTSEPQACFANYDTDSVAFQNCIAINGEDNNEMPDTTYDGIKGFFTPNGCSHTYFEGCIALDFEGAGYWLEGTPIVDVSLKNCIAWDVHKVSYTVGYAAYLLYCRYDATGGPVVVDHCTFGVSDLGEGITAYEALPNRQIKNSIIYGVYLNSGFYAVTGPWAYEDYNCYYNNTGNRNFNGTLGSHSKTTINPLTNSLRYLPRIESGSSLDGQASDGGDIGATVVNKIGQSGKLWGESGWNVDTGESLWPFPNEAQIKSDISSYDDRGFCAAGETLTHYIWNYLGNGGFPGTSTSSSSSSSCRSSSSSSCSSSSCRSSSSSCCSSSSSSWSYTSSSSSSRSSSSSSCRSSSSSSCRSSSSSCSSSSCRSSSSSCRSSSSSSSSSCRSSSSSCSSSSSSISSKSSSSSSCRSSSSSSSCRSSSSSSSTNLSSSSSSSSSCRSSSSSSSSCRSSSSSSSSYSGSVNYSRDDVVAIPATDADLPTPFTAQNYVDVAAVDSVFVTQDAIDQYAIKLFKKKFASVSEFQATWTGKSTRAPSLSAVSLSAYNHTTGLWVQLAANSTAGANVPFTLSGSVAVGYADYFDAGGWVSFMVSQRAV